ncbi:MAG: tail fiber domain-containing protein [bacterium]|nr:tail fiber domain-containing protein [bacterium]
MIAPPAPSRHNDRPPNPEAPSRHQLMVVNDYFADPVSLIAGTRFQTADGNIFRSEHALTVPGKAGTANGTTLISVIPAMSGTVPSGRLTLPGLATTRNMYAHIYAEVASSSLAVHTGSAHVAAATLAVTSTSQPPPAPQKTAHQQPTASPQYVTVGTQGVERTMDSTGSPRVERVTAEPMPAGRQSIVAVDGISESTLNQRLQELDTKLTSKIFSISAPQSSAPSIQNIYTQIAQSQRIDTLASVDISDSIWTSGTITGATISGASISGGTVAVASLSGTLGIGSGGTGQTTFGQGWIFSDGTSALSASTSPTVNYLTATSTLIASRFPYASSTALTATNLFSTNGVITYASSTALTVSGTSFLTNILATASSTIGSGTQAGGLTIFGGATSTGNLIVQGSATSTFSNGISTSYLNITGTSATSTFGNGLSLNTGCFALAGTCLIGNAQLLASANTWTGLQAFSNTGTTTFSGGIYATQIAAPYFNATSTSATSTFLGGITAPNGYFTTASTTNLTISGLRGSLLSTDMTGIVSATTTIGNTYLTNAGALTVTAGSGLTGGGAVALGGTISLTAPWPWSLLTTYSTSTNATTTPAWFLTGLFASSTSQFAYASTTALTATTGFFTTASTTNLTVSSIQNSLLFTNGTGVVSGTTTLATNFGGTGASTFGQGWMYSNGGTSALAASTSPTVNYLVATSTTATSTFAWGIQANALNITGTSATSTFARGVDLAGGCFSILGTCVGGGQSISGTIGQLAYFSGTNTQSATSTLTLGTNSFLGIGTTSPLAKLTVYGDAFLEGTSRYLNFGTTQGTSGYGFRDNSGTLEFKNSGGTWQGVTTATSGPSFFVNKGESNQTVTANVEAVVTWSTETFDTNSNFASNRFTPTVPGKYVIALSLYCTSNTSYCEPIIYKNTSQIAEGIGGGSNAGGSVTAIVDLNGTTDYVEARVITDGTTVSGTSYRSHFSGALIAPVNSNNAAGWTNDGTQSYLLDNADKVGIGTSTPWGKLSITATDNAAIPQFVVASSSAVSFLVNSSGNVGIAMTGPSVALDVTGDIEYTGTITDVSDERLKENFAPLESNLAKLAQLDPVSFNMIGDDRTQLGFTAQNAQTVFPNTVSVIDPENGYLGLDYTQLIAPAIGAIQELNLKLESIASSTQPEHGSFAANFFSNLFARITAWLADAANGITDFFAQRGHFSNELCVGDTCVTPDQFKAMVAASNQSGTGSSSSSAGPMSSNSQQAADTEPPIITIDGENPAHIHVGDTYQDLGARITAPEEDTNLGIKTYLNGALVSNIVLDTSQAATATIDYVVTGHSSLTSTSTRTVIIDPTDVPSIVPPDSATDTPPLIPPDDATSTTTTATI